MSHVTRKPVFRVFDKVRLNTACLSKETSLSLEIANVGTRDIILSRQRTTKELIAYGISRFSHDMAHMVELLWWQHSDCC